MAQWERHIDTDDHHIVKFRAKIFPDGTIRFIFKNFQPGLKDVAAKSGFPTIVGIQDGFATKKPDQPKGLKCDLGAIQLQSFRISFLEFSPREVLIAQAVDYWTAAKRVRIAFNLKSKVGHKDTINECHFKAILNE